MKKSELTSLIKEAYQEILKEESQPANYFTFGGYAGEALRPYCVKIMGTSASAREKMFKAFGPKWAFQYDAPPHEKIIELEKAKKLFKTND